MTFKNHKPAKGNRICWIR